MNDDVIEPEGKKPADWVGERVRAYMETGEEVQGALLDVTEHGIVVGRKGTHVEGPCFYSWRIIQWLEPVDRQTTR